MKPRAPSAAAAATPRSHTHEHEHGHIHEHDHSHAHPPNPKHEHTHPPNHEHHHAALDLRRLPGDPESHRSPLAPGAGAGKILFLDAFSGIAGDMAIAAFVDLGVPFEVVEKAVAALRLTGFALRLERAQGGAIGGSKFDVDVCEVQPARTYASIAALLAGSELNAGTLALAQRAFRRLAEAEADVHRIPIAAVAFHEVGAVDAIVDIVGAAACVDYLGAAVWSSPLPMGRGSIDCQHGALPLPAPATIGCLRGIPTYAAEIDAELVTPTGAALVASFADHFVRWPELSPERSGFGFGTRVLPDRVNALRVVLGAPNALPESQGPTSHVVIEANVDDLTGELAAHAIERLLDSGALDAWATPIVMKKGRPALMLSVLVQTPARDRLTEVLLRETSSIGVRYRGVDRVERPRRSLDVVTRFGPIPIKVSEGPFGPARIKPEFDACARAAAAAGVSVSEVLAAALEAYAGLR